MRTRLIDISDKRPHSAAPDWSQSDLENPRPQKLAQTFMVETQTSPSGDRLLTWGGRGSSTDFPWHHKHSREEGYTEYSDEDVAMSLRVWMVRTFEDAFPITRELIDDTMSMLAALCVESQSSDRK